MITSEPLTTGVVLLVVGLLVALSTAFSRASSRFGLPVVLLFLGVGVLAGTEGLGRISFGDYPLAFRAGTAALVLILFDGGLNTPIASIRAVVRPAAALATLGVLVTAALAAAAARLLGLPWPEALLLGAVVSPTDAAAVFSVLRGARVKVRRRVALVLETEAGFNDPMAVVLMLGLTQLLTGQRSSVAAMVGLMAVQLTVGLAIGLGAGAAGRALLPRLRLAASGLYPVFTMALAFTTYGAATVLQGSGFLAVYVAALILGNGALPYQAGVRRVHDSIAWLAQVGMFVLLGLLVLPSRLWAVARPGLGIALLLALVARPVAVALSLAPFRFRAREQAFIAWAGLRGASPIVLATFPVLAHAPGAERIFQIVFFVVAVNALVPGATLRAAVQALGLASRADPPPPATLEIMSRLPVDGEILSFFIEPESAVSGTALRDLPFPEGASILLLVRGHRLVPARGGTVIEPGDHVHVFCRPPDKPFVLLLFGREA